MILLWIYGSILGVLASGYIIKWSIIMIGDTYAYHRRRRAEALDLLSDYAL